MASIAWENTSEHDAPPEPASCNLRAPVSASRPGHGARRMHPRTTQPAGRGGLYDSSCDGELIYIL
jgi:hypothetical protein